MSDDVLAGRHVECQWIRRRSWGGAARPDRGSRGLRRDPGCPRVVGQHGQCLCQVAGAYEWIAEQPDDRDPRNPDLSGHQIAPVPMRAGDLCIWTSRLPRGNGHNTSAAIRLARYVTMIPALVDFADYHERRARRIQSGRTRSPVPTPTDYHSREQSLPAPPLSDLGRKLLGLDGGDDRACEYGPDPCYS